MNPGQRKFVAAAVVVFMLLALQIGSNAEVYAAPGDLTRASVDSSGAQANGASRNGQISGDGRYVTFGSSASNLVADDTNNAEDVFVHDRQTGATTRVSVASLSGAQANSDSGGAAISSDGRYVAFESSATNLVTVDTNNQSDVFLHDRQTGATTLVSVDSAGMQANDISEDVSLSADGRFAVFTSPATNLVGGDTNGMQDVFVRDTQTGVTALVSVNSSGAQASSSSFSPQISANGRYVVFVSGAPNLVDGDTNGQADIFVRDLQTGETTRASVNSNGEQGDRLARDPSISGDGRFVSFSSYSNNLKSEDTYGWEYLYVRDRQAGTTTLESIYADGYTMYGWSEESVISADGRYVAFMFDDKGDSMPNRWVYIRDRVSGATLSATPVDPRRPAFSADGRFISYDSVNAVLPGDTNGVSDIYVKKIAYPPDLNPAVKSVINKCPYGCSGPADAVVNFTVSFSETVTGVDVSDFMLTVGGGVTGAAITGVSGSHDEYIVSVNTGAGDGTLRLDILDDDSIKDFPQNPLGGIGAGNGNFTGGETYVVDKIPPTVAGIARVDQSPTMSDSGNFLVTFSEDVSGVDAGDFALTSIGNISGAGIVEISGSGKSYSVKVNTGTGDGTLRLDLLDDDGIRDIVARPLGGDGVGNGNFASGDVYQMDKSIPAVTGSLRADADPTAADNIRFTVTFSEAVSGVDASDFMLSTTDSLSGAYIASLEGSANIYTVTVATGSGNGNLRLDLLDNDSIVDSVNQPLGGVGAGNFTTGDSYLIDKSAPASINIQRADVNSTAAESVRFVVTFSESVSGVDAGDFMPAITGNLSGAYVTAVSGSANLYTVTVATGSGSGDIRLDLADNDSIIDTANNPLGGLGAGNGNFSATELYAVDKVPPTVTGILPVDPNLTGADNVRFTVNFSENVTGVDAGDFALFATGALTGAAVTDVSGFGNIYTITVATGAGDGTLRLDLLDNDGILDVANNPLGGAGADNGAYNIGGTYALDKSAPTVTGILRTDPNPASADTVKFTVIFSETVGGVDAGDFALSTTGGVTGAAVTSVSVGDAPNTYLVTANTGTGSGELRLDVLDDDSVVDPVGHPLGGAGAGNGFFAGSETYMVAKDLVPFVETFGSNGTNDGWILESRETSEQGGDKNAADTTFNLGDNALNRQYRAILHFSTASIPDNAVVTSVTLRIKRQGLIGTDPFTTHQNILADIRSGVFGLPGVSNINALNETDFQAAASRDAAGVIQNNPIDGWYWTQLDAAALPYINLIGETQFRLRFQVDDNNDWGDDYMKFYSGDGGVYRPQLQVEYYVPNQSPPPTVTPAPTPIPAPTTDEKYTIARLRSRTYGGGTLDIFRQVSRERKFTTYLARYSSDGLAVYALVNLPNDTKVHPVIITLHGYYSAQTYDLFRDTGSINARLAQQGFITIHPAMRNYAPSENGDNLFRVGQTVDVLNLIAIIKAHSGEPGLLEYADSGHIGLEGTSTGGGVALRILTVNNDVKAAVLYASISGDERHNVPLFQRITSDAQFAGEPGVPDNALALISPSSYYSSITAPVFLAHGINDRTIPVDWGRETCDLLKAADVNTTCIFYKKAGHAFIGETLDTFISKAAEFFHKYLY